MLVLQLLCVILAVVLCKKTMKELFEDVVVRMILRIQQQVT